MKNVKPSLLTISVLVALFGGMTIGGTFAWLSMKPTSDAMQNRDSDGTEKVVGRDKKLTYFQEHYVNFGGNYARIPLKFCQAFYDFYTECGPDLPYMEIDLKQHPLPVSKILSAATDINHRIVYAEESTNKTSIGCPIPDLYSYEFKGGIKKLKNNESMWICGAIGSYIQELSPGGRYVRIETYGPAEASGFWLYDIDHDTLDSQTTHSRIVTFFSGEESNEDNYLVYLGGCENEALLTLGTFCEETLILRDNHSGKTVILTAVMNALEQKGIDLASVSQVHYSSQNGGTLYLRTGDIDRELTIKNFNKYFSDLK
jgi:hypothetical protein